MLRVPSPKAFEFRSPRKDFPRSKPIQQVATVEFFDPLHECIELRGAMTCERQAPPLNFQHMLIPRLDPAAIDYIETESQLSQPTTKITGARVFAFSVGSRRYGSLPGRIG